MINFAELKKFFIWNFIGSLIIAALVAVVTVLIGRYTEVTGRVYLTLFMVILHSLVSLSFIWDDSRHDTFNKLSFFINTIFLFIVVSFITSLFGIWKIVPGTHIWHLYQTYFIIGFASLHMDILSKALRKEKYMDMVIAGNYVFIAAVVIMFVPIIFVENSTMVLGEMYFRFLAAACIIDGTLSILTIIFYKLYLHNHPELENVTQGTPAVAGQAAVPARRKGLSIWVWILIIYLCFQVVGPFFWMLGGMWR